MAISRELLNILVCPQCRGGLDSAANGSGLVCAACGIKYPVREDIPIMLIEEAEKINEG